MGDFTKNLTKQPGKRSFGQGTAALVSAVLDAKAHTSVEQFLLAYGGEDGLADFLEWLEKEATPKQKWTCEVSYQENNLIAYLDDGRLTVMIRETPKGRWLPHTIPCKHFVPDESLKTLIADARKEGIIKE